MNAPYILSDHAIDRAMERLDAFPGIGRKGVKRVMRRMLVDAAPIGAQMGNDFLLLGKHKEPAAELVFCCRPTPHGIMVATVLSQEQAIVNMQAWRRKKVDVG